MSSIFGEDQIEIVKLQLFGHQPFTPRLDDVQFEYLLQKTHEALLKNVGQNKIGEKLVPFSGPQCHEDRDNKPRMDYSDRESPLLTRNPLRNPRLKRLKFLNLTDTLLSQKLLRQLRLFLHHQVLIRTKMRMLSLIALSVCVKHVKRLDY